jgi:predicted RND superfamily exporter protein
MLERYRKSLLALFLILSAGSIYLAYTRLTFSYELEDFFPDGDPDLAFFQSFRKNFEPDDNFLLVAIERKAGVFEQDFLQKVHDFTLKARTLPHVREAVSLTKLSYPVKLPMMGFSAIEAVHLDDPSRFPRDSARALGDERIVGRLINEDATALVVAMKTIDNLSQRKSEELMAGVDSLLAGYGFERTYLLGKANFADKLVKLAKREFLYSVLASGFLVLLVMSLIFRRFWGVVVSMSSIVLGMLIFMGILGAIGEPLDALAALYPIVMIIVCTSDVVHVMSKYIDELQKGRGRMEAIQTTLSEIGVAVFVTSVTTAIGFVTLCTSQVPPVRAFGINAAIGVMVAYLVVLGFTLAALSYFRADQIIRPGQSGQFWIKGMEWFYRTTKSHPRRILGVFGLITLLCLWGTSKVSTNYRIEETMPRGQQVTEDFVFFEKAFSGFRPFEVAVMAQDTYTLDDYAVLEQMDRLEGHLRSYDALRSITSATLWYKSLNRAYAGDRAEAYRFPKDTSTFEAYRKMVDKFKILQTDVLVSRDRKQGRISARVLDIGADSIAAISQGLRQWASVHLDSQVVRIRETGTGVIIDRNGLYVRDNLLWGLGGGVLLIALVMAFMLRSPIMVLISAVPNLFPLLIAGALLGFTGIKLEAGAAMVFSIVYGIAVDDTVHFLSKFRLARSWGYTVDQALHHTFVETGKAVSLTTLILFFGFVILLFSAYPPSFTIGLLSSVTLFAGLFCDLFLLPVLVRALVKDH